MKILKLGLFVFNVALCSVIHAQQKPDISGYVSEMPSIITMSNSEDVQWQNLIHNRLNFNWQISDYWKMETGMRNRLISGSETMISPERVDFDAGWADLSWNIFSSQNTILNTTFDRLNLTFEKDKLSLKIGRQRINWGQTFVWNPNDIFNTYSFFDFDYPERPGCDAFRGTYYHSETTSSELAVSVDHYGKTTAALQHHWNWKNFDYQLIVGEQAESDMVIGGAWTGDFNGLNFRGEFSYFHPMKAAVDTGGIVAVSVGMDYVFSNSLMLQAEMLYNNVGKMLSGNGFMGLYSAPLSAKYLSICDWNVFTQVSHSITPRLNASLSGMYFVDIQSYYAGLSLDYSLIENLDFSFIAQYFSSLGNAQFSNMQFLLGFARLKYSF